MASPASATSTSWRVALAAIVLAAAMIGAIALLRPGWIGLGPGEPSRSDRPVAAQAGTPVETVRAATERVADQVEALGTLAANEQVPIAAEVAGRIVAFHFREGQEVEAGARLVDLDPTIAQAELQQAEANLSLAQDVYDRSQTLVQRGAGTQVALEQATAQLAVARANAAAARTKLGQLTLSAPFSGVVGLRSTSVGTIIPAGQAITTLTGLDPIKVDFSIPELFLSSVSTGQSVDVRVDAVPDRRFTGKVYAIDPVVDPSGRTLRLRATIDNADRTLRPGLFARVALTTAVRDDAIVVPEAALVASGTGQESAIYIISEGRAAMKVVATGRRFDGKVEITEGLRAGEQVVVAGHVRLRDGARVTVTEAPSRLQPPAPASATSAAAQPIPAPARAVP
ncbi:efflux RND transporter periplasmic adaptor subunit [Phreatobacter sp.]|uniref:efflux RND transporter periplasmic adaptor subunit n=1 Tax=Phreatobacter sp. TaxID=1966341 RepID=UPI003F711C22